MELHTVRPALARAAVPAVRPHAPSAPLWLWPNLLSLDAPVVAGLWQILFARCYRVPLDGWAVVVLMATVWLIYAADRILDSNRPECATERHEFYRRNRQAVRVIWLAGLVLTAIITMQHLAGALFERGAVLLSLVGIYLALVHALEHTAWLKEAVVGVLFAAGTSLAAWNGVRNGANATGVILFAALCCINCVLIETWEAGAKPPEMKQPETLTCAALAVALAAGVLVLVHGSLLFAAETASAVALLALQRVAPGLSLRLLRVLADAILLSPVLFLPFT